MEMLTEATRGRFVRARSTCAAIRHLTGQVARGSMQGHGLQHLAHLPAGGHRTLPIPWTQWAARPHARGVARPAQGAVHDLRRRVRFRRGYRTLHVRHRRFAQDLPGVADGPEVARRRLPHLAGHSSLAIATDRLRSPWWCSGTKSRWIAVPARSTVSADESKGLLFFTAFLPQFIDPARSLFIQFVIMAGTFAVIEIATEVFIASMAHRISPWLQRVGRRFNQACGGVFVAIGVALPLRS